MSGPSFFAELQRRHVYKVGAAYAVAAWLLVQAVTQVLPVFGVSMLGQRVLALSLIAGFPLALVLAWLFDLTPQGIVRTVDAPAGEAAPALTRTRRSMDRRLNYVLGALVVIGIGYVVVEQGLLKSTGTTAPAASDKSIAVLPFDNLSDDHANAYFAEGIQDEILTRLAKIAALKVISRTSTQQYAAKPGNLPEIARQLGVANIVEGSVQKAGDAVRVNVQLIRAASDTHLWAETYDRHLDNLFTVQSEVAAAIAEQLRAQLSSDEKKTLATSETTNPQAYDAWLRALAYLHRGEEDPVGTEQAIKLLEDATRLDPDFAAAWAQLSKSHGSQYVQSYDQTRARRDAVKAALDQALRLAPEADDTQLAKGYYQYWIERDYAAAITTFGALEARRPNNTEAIRALGFVDRRQGRFDNSLRLLNRAVAIDPRDITLLTETAWTYQQLRDNDGALRIFDRALDIKPDDASLIADKAAVYQSMGRLDDAGALLSKIRADAEFPDVVNSLVEQWRLSRRYADGVRLLQQMLTQTGSGPTPLQLISYRAALGDLQLRAGDAAARATLLQVRAALEEERQRQPDNDVLMNLLAQVEANLGDRTAAMRAIDRAIALLPSAKDAMYGPWHEEIRARIQLRFGDDDAAIAELTRLLKVPYAFATTPERLRLDPDFDRLRGDLRLQSPIAVDAAGAAAPPMRSTPR